MEIPDRSFRFVDVPLAELLALPRSNAYWEIRGEAPLMIRTEIPEQNTFVLNVFPPREHIFWSMSCFTPFRKAEANYVLSLGLAQLQKFIRGLIGREGALERQSAVYCLLGLLSQQHGDQLTAVVPREDGDRLRAYFEAQAAMKDEVALRACDEHVYFVSWGQDSRFPWYDLLHRAVALLTAEERHRYCRQLDEWADDPEALVSSCDLPPRFYYPALVQLGSSGQVDSSAYADCVRILKFRARFLASVATLAALDEHFSYLGQFESFLHEEDLGAIMKVLRRRLDGQSFVSDAVIRGSLAKPRALA
jgi:hypothetical protein